MLKCDLSSFRRTANQGLTRTRSSRRRRVRGLAWAADFAVQALESRVLLSGLTPAQVRDAYGLNGVTFGGTPADGLGQTVAIVIPYNDDIAQLDADTLWR
jgi:hypothetical protein